MLAPLAIVSCSFFNWALKLAMVESLSMHPAQSSKSVSRDQSVRDNRRWQLEIVRSAFDLLMSGGEILRTCVQRRRGENKAEAQSAATLPRCRKHRYKNDHMKLQEDSYVENYNMIK